VQQSQLLNLVAQVLDKHKYERYLEIMRAALVKLGSEHADSAKESAKQLWQAVNKEK
jgi:hypothetical protein